MAGTAHQPMIYMELKCYHGLKEIASFLGISRHTAMRWINKGMVPAKKDLAGRWVLTNIDYYQSLQG